MGASDKVDELFMKKNHSELYSERGHQNFVNLQIPQSRNSYSDWEKHELSKLRILQLQNNSIIDEKTRISVPTAPGRTPKSLIFQATM